jgi:hypothetical protein
LGASAVFAVFAAKYQRAIPPAPQESSDPDNLASQRTAEYQLLLADIFTSRISDVAKIAQSWAICQSEWNMGGGSHLG